NQVQFSYDNERIALHDISLSVKAGETVALVGHTGSGKSSIANLISRFYDPTKGSVEIDGYDLRHVELESLRQRISVVLQDTFIFSGTIMENIRFGRSESRDQEVSQVSEEVAADAF